MKTLIQNGFMPMSFVESLVGIGVAKITSAAVKLLFERHYCALRRAHLCHKLVFLRQQYL